MSLKSVRIDETSSCHGSLQKSNYSTWPMLSESPSNKLTIITDVMNSIADFATSLAGITDGIEHLYFSGSFIPADAYKVLLTSQKAIRTLHVKKGDLLARLGKMGKQKISIPEELSDEQLNMALAEGIVRHETSLEDISIWIEAENFKDPISFHKVVQMLGEKQEYFPNLQSIAVMCAYYFPGCEFPSTSMFHHRNLAEVSLLEEIKSTELFFERTFSKNKITKLSVLRQTGSDGSRTSRKNIFEDSLFTWLLSKHLERGSISNLKEINGAVLDATKQFSMEEMRLFFKRNPDVTHIDFIHSSTSEDAHMLNIIQHYGHQLLQLKGFYTEAKAEHIAKYCSNLQSLGVVYDSAVPCLFKLEKLKKLTMDEVIDTERIEGIIAKLTKLSILYIRFPEVLHVIREHARCMKSLSLNCGLGHDRDSFLSLMDGLVQLLGELSGLKKLHFQILVEKRLMDEWEERNNRKGIDKIAELLLKNHTGLKRLHLSFNVSMSQASKAKLVDSMPQCKITFEDEILD